MALFETNLNENFTAFKNKFLKSAGKKSKNLKLFSQTEKTEKRPG